MDEVGREVGERHQREGALVQARVREHEAGLVQHQLAVEQEVEVEAPRRVADAGAHTAGERLDREQPLEQRARRERGAERHRRVQVRALRRPADRRGLVDRRHREHGDALARAQPRQREVEERAAVAQVRAERDERAHRAGTAHLRDPAGAAHAARVSLQSSSVSPFEQLPPLLRTAVPGPRSRAHAARLAEVESRSATCVLPTPPVVWERASGSNVWDVDGNRFVDLTAGFGVANVGHAHPRVVEAVQEQVERLVHALGDVHPARVKVALLEALARRFPGGGPAKALLGTSGSDAVEAALETALLATGRAGVVAFEGAYHGLALGALDATHRPFFRDPFAARLPGATCFARFGDADDARRAARESRHGVGAVLVEPIQGRGGERVPPRGFLRALRELCDAEGWLLVIDEVYTGFGRTGRWFACEDEGVVPDLLCVGKGLAGGMALSACVGRAEVMDRWPASQGESLHTQTFLGHPPACAAALASLAVLEEEKLPERAAEVGARALARLRRTLADEPGIRDVRGRGLLLGIECDTPGRAARACAGALARGILVVASGDDGRVVSITPP